MDYQRKQLKEQVISHYMGGNKSFAFGDLATTKPYLRIAARTNSGKVYVLRMELGNIILLKKCTFYPYYSGTEIYFFKSAVFIFWGYFVLYIRPPRMSSHCYKLFDLFSSIFPIKPLFGNRGRYIVVTKSAGRM